MVTLKIGAKLVSWDAGGKVFAKVAATQTVEFLDESGQVLATSIPAAESAPDWARAITPEEIEQAKAGPLYTFDVKKKKLGWE